MITTVSLLFSSPSAVTPEDSCVSPVEVFAIPASVEPDLSCNSVFTRNSCYEFK